MSSVARTNALTPRSMSLFDIYTSNWSSKLGGNDVVSNMLSLNPFLHAKWGLTCFGIRRLGNLPWLEINDTKENRTTLVQLQFVWLPRRRSASDTKGKGKAKSKNGDEDKEQKDISLKKFNLATERVLYSKLRDASSQAEISEESDSVLMLAYKTSANIPNGDRCFDVETTAQIFSGQTIDLQIPAKQIEMFCEMTDVAWVMTYMAAISGAAEAVDKGWHDSEGQGPHMVAYFEAQVEPEGAEKVSGWLSG